MIVLIALLLSIALTVALAILVLPSKKRANLPKFFIFLHDLFNFKYLIIEKILKILYVFATVACLVYGFLTLITSPATYVPGAMALTGLLTMIVGPIVVRISFELMMTFLLLVKNTIEINNKIKNQTKDKQQSIFDNTEEYINQIIPEQKVCQKCGVKISKDGKFCTNCGEKVE